MPDPIAVHTVFATTPPTTSTFSWDVDDLFVVLGSTGDNGDTLGTPSASGSGLSFSAMTGSPTNTASSCKGYAWSAIATDTDSGTISATVSFYKGFLAVFQYRGDHNGVGNKTLSASGTGTTASLTRSGANSGVCWLGADWNATNDVVVSPTPGGGIQEHAERDASSSTVFAFEWGDQGSVGTTSYGITGFSTSANFTKIAVEILAGGGGGAPTPVRREVIGQAVNRAATWCKRTPKGVLVPDLWLPNMK